MPALEPSHALHQTMELAKSLPKENIVFLGRHGKCTRVSPVVLPFSPQGNSPALLRDYFGDDAGQESPDVEL